MMRERKTLDRVLSRAGAMSRKQAEVAIRGGRVRVNGLRVVDPASWVDLPQDRVTLDDQPLGQAAPVYLALHKPVGYVTTRSDERRRATVYELVRDIEGWIAPVGRLDLDTSGLLLFTNDTALADSIASPRSKLAKTYAVVASGELGEAQLARLGAGIALDDGPTEAARVALLGREDGRTRIEISITEGRNRQVRRMFEAIGSCVIALHRSAIGPVELGDLAEGRHRPLTTRELRGLRAG